MPKVTKKANALLVDSESHVPSATPFRELRCGIGLDTCKTITVQCPLMKPAQV